MIVLASTSPQRRAILEQLRIPFRVVAPAYDEAGDDPVEHAVGKARSVNGGGEPVLGVDTVVVLDGDVLGKPADAEEATSMLGRLAGQTHEVVSGLCLRTDEWEERGRAVTDVTFRELTAEDIERPLPPASGMAARARTRSRASAPRSSSGSTATTSTSSACQRHSSSRSPHAEASTSSNSIHVGGQTPRRQANWITTRLAPAREDESLESGDGRARTRAKHVEHEAWVEEPRPGCGGRSKAG